MYNTKGLKAQTDEKTKNVDEDKDTRLESAVENEVRPNGDKEKREISTKCRVFIRFITIKTIMYLRVMCQHDLSDGSSK